MLHRASRGLAGLRGVAGRVSLGGMAPWTQSKDLAAVPIQLVMSGTPCASACWRGLGCAAPSAEMAPVRGSAVGVVSKRFMSDKSGDGANKGSNEGEADTAGKPQDRSAASATPPRMPVSLFTTTARNRTLGGFASLGSKAVIGGTQTLGARGGRDPYGRDEGRSAPADDTPPPQFDPALLEKLGISHVNPYRIAQVLKDDEITLEEIAEQMDMGFHLLKDGQDDMEYELAGMGWSQILDENQPAGAGGADGAEVQPKAPEKKEPQWDVSMMKQLLPVRKFFPGQTYQPEDLSPDKPVDWKQMRRTTKFCPLGGKKGPRVDWTNGFLLSKFITEGGNIKPRRVTKVCALKQRELARAVKRARIMGILARTSRPSFGDKLRGFKDED